MSAKRESLPFNVSRHPNPIPAPSNNNDDDDDPAESMSDLFECLIAPSKLYSAGIFLTVLSAALSLILGGITFVIPNHQYVHLYFLAATVPLTLVGIYIVYRSSWGVLWVLPSDHFGHCIKLVEHTRGLHCCSKQSSKSSRRHTGDDDDGNPTSPKRSRSNGGRDYAMIPPGSDGGEYVRLQVPFEQIVSVCAIDMSEDQTGAKKKKGGRQLPPEERPYIIALEVRGDIHATKRQGATSIVPIIEDRTGQTSAFAKPDARLLIRLTGVVGAVNAANRRAQWDRFFRRRGIDLVEQLSHHESGSGSGSGGGGPNNSSNGSGGKQQPSTARHSSGAGGKSGGGDNDASTTTVLLCPEPSAPSGVEPVLADGRNTPPGMSTSFDGGGALGSISDLPNGAQQLPPMNRRQHRGQSYTGMLHNVGSIDGGMGDDVQPLLALAGPSDRMMMSNGNGGGNGGGGGGPSRASNVTPQNTHQSSRSGNPSRGPTTGGENSTPGGRGGGGESDDEDDFADAGWKQPQQRGRDSAERHQSTSSNRTKNNDDDDDDYFGGSLNEPPRGSTNGGGGVLHAPPLTPLSIVPYHHHGSDHHQHPLPQSAGGVTSVNRRGHGGSDAASRVPLAAPLLVPPSSNNGRTA